MSTEHMIEITGCDLVALVKKAYELSTPRGLGFLHAQPGGLTDEQAASLVKADSRWPVSLDYVIGRAVKFNVYRDGEKLYTNDRWYDHSAQQLRDLLAHVGMAEKSDQVTA